MTATIVRRILTCLRCSHTWRPMVVRPATCPRCRRQDWDAEEDAPKPAPPPEAPCVYRDTCRAEYAMFLARQQMRDAVATADYRERRGERRYAADEVDVRPPMMQDGTPLVLAKLTLTRRSHRRKAT